MKAASTLTSLPGDWVDRHGRPRPRTPLTKILVLKADHIGDLLIASGAFELLRYYFADARIDLACGKWNRELAIRLAVFDNVYAIDLFDENSGLQSDPAVALAARRRGVAGLAALAPHGYDLVVDLRYDRDTRPMLPATQGRIYAGFGSRTEFPFLDVALPIHEGASGRPDGTVHDIVLGGRDFADAEGASGCRPGAIVAEHATISVAFDISGARSPADCDPGSGDRRRLGVGLEMVVLTPQGADDAHPPLVMKPGDAGLTLTSGWDRPEPFGAWSIADAARLDIALPQSGCAEYRLDVVCRSHVNWANPEVGCRLTAIDASAETVFDLHERKKQRISVPVSRQRRRVVLSAQPVRLAPGRYEGALSLYLPKPVAVGASIDVCIQSPESGAPLLQHEVGAADLQEGLTRVEFSFEAVSARDPVVVSLRTRQPFAFDAAQIEMLALHCVEPFNLLTPVGHMEHWAELLVHRVAQMFSPISLPFASTSHVRLAERDRDLEPPAADLRRRRHAGACLVGVSLACNSEIRKWPAGHFITLCKQLKRMERVEILFLGGESDLEEATEAARQLHLDPSRHVFCGATSLAGLGPLLAELDVFIGNNTGVTHFAGKVGVRTFGVYAGTNHPGEWGPIGPNASWIYRNEPCAPCHLTRIEACGHAHVCMTELLPEEVFRAVETEVRSVLSRRGGDAARRAHVRSIA